jgi:hypothetical protein
LEIGLGLSTAMALGLGLGFVTLTMRHQHGQSLVELWDAAAKAWRRATSGNSWKLARERCGLAGWVRVWEVTIGRNGWHVHVHVALVFEGTAIQERLDDIAGGMFNRWSRGLREAGLEAPLLRGQEWHVVGGDRAGEDLAEYLSSVAKSGADSIGMELTQSLPGRSRGAYATRPPFELLTDVMEDGDGGALRRWHEWERGSLGRRQIGWSKGLRERLGAGIEVSDEAVAAEELGSTDDDLVLIEAGGWAAMVRQPERLPFLLSAAQAGGLARVRATLDDWGDVPYVLA